MTVMNDVENLLKETGQRYQTFLQLMVRCPEVLAENVALREWIHHALALKPIQSETLSEFSKTRSFEEFRNCTLQQTQFLHNCVAHLNQYLANGANLPLAKTKSRVQKPSCQADLLDDQLSYAATASGCLDNVLQRVESLHTDVMDQFQSAFSETSDAYSEVHLLLAVHIICSTSTLQLQIISLMAELYVPLRIKVIGFLWQVGGPTLDYIGTYIAAPVVKTYGKKYLWPDIRDFIVRPYFQTDYDGGDPMEFRLTFPRRSFSHWVCAITFDCALFVFSKLSWDIAWALFCWSVISNWYYTCICLSMMCGILSIFSGLSGVGVIAAVLWWFMWYLTPTAYTNGSKAIVMGWGAVSILLMCTIAAFTIWVTLSAPLWNLLQ